MFADALTGPASAGEARLRAVAAATFANLAGAVAEANPSLDRRQVMHTTGNYTLTDLAELFNISRPTVYRTINRQTR